MTKAAHETTLALAEMQLGIAQLVTLSHGASKARGWWHDPITGISLIPGDHIEGNYETNHTAMGIVEAWFPYVIGTKIALIHSETSEGLEAYRKDAIDDKITDFAGITAEMADVLIRVGDLMGCLQLRAINRYMANGALEAESQEAQDEEEATILRAYSLSSAVYEKMLVNAVRPDHNVEARRKPGGKKF